jgi:hypothetical protein
MPDAPADLPKLPSAHAKRLAWALKESDHLLAEALRKDTSAEAREVEKLPEEQIPAQVVSLILEKADPTQNKGMTSWLAKQYARGDLRLEDLGTANETLTMFQRYAPRLGPVQRDLGRYPDLAAVWEAVIGFANDEEQHLSAKAQKALDRDKAYAESRILRQDEDGFTIAVPLTEFAAKWWGKGTRWCTAAEKDNQFKRYSWYAPLIVVVVPGLERRGKFQLWATEANIEFADAADRTPQPALIGKSWRYFDRLFSSVLRINGQFLKHVPKQLRSLELCAIAVKQSGLNLKFVPWAHRTPEICEIAVSQNAHALTHVRVRDRTEGLCKIAVEQMGRILGEIPKHLWSEEICKIALAQDGRALESVPDNLRSEELCRIALSQTTSALRFVPLSLRDFNLCKFVLERDGHALQYVPDRLRTPDLCEIAVKTHAEALRFVPEDFRSKALCEHAVRHHGRALEHVPRKLRTEKMCKLALGETGWALGHVPDALRTEEIRRLAIEKNGEVLCNVFSIHRTKELCEAAVRQNYKALVHVPVSMRTEEMCRIAVTKDGGALWLVPEALLTEEICKIAVAQDGLALRDVPIHLRTEALCEIAVRQTRQALGWVPDELFATMEQFAKPLGVDWDIGLLDELKGQIAPIPEHGGLEMMPPIGVAHLEKMAISCM